MVRTCGPSPGEYQKVCLAPNDRRVDHEVAVPSLLTLVYSCPVSPSLCTLMISGRLRFITWTKVFYFQLYVVSKDIDHTLARYCVSGCGLFSAALYSE